MTMNERASSVLQVARHELVQEARGAQATEATEASLANIIKKSTGELPMTMDFLGLCKAGKSQLQSAMIGRDVLPSASKPCTSIPTIYRHSSNRELCRIFYAHYDDDLQAQVSTSAVFEGTAEECKRHLNDLNDRARHLAATLWHTCQENADADGVQEDYIITAMRREGVPMYTVVEVYIQGLVEAGVPEEALSKWQFVDSPGKGEAFNPVVDLTIKGITALSDLVVCVMDYRCIGTEGDAALWQALQEQRPDLLRELGDRSLFFLSHADASGANAMSVGQASDYARQKVLECTNYLPSEEQFTGGSGLGGSAARHMLRYHSDGTVPSDEVMRGAIAPMVDADYPEDVTFEDACEEVGKEEWQRRLREEYGLAVLEEKIASRLVRADALMESICNSDLRRVCATILADVKATVSALEQSNEVLQAHKDTLATVIAGVHRFCDEDIAASIGRSRAEALRAITDTVRNINATLRATADDIIRVAQARPRSVFENKEAAQMHVAELAAQVRRNLRQDFAARGGNLRDVLNTQVAAVMANFENVLLPAFQAYLVESFEKLDVDAPTVAPVDSRQLEREQENVRQEIVRLGIVDDNEINNGIQRFVQANTFTVQETRIQQRRVCVGRRGPFWRRKRVYAMQNYSVVVDVQRTNYPVEPAVVETFVRGLFLTNLDNVMTDFANATEDIFGHLHQVLTTAVTAPLATAQARVDMAVATKQAAEHEQSAKAATLRQQCELLAVAAAGAAQ